MATLYIFLSVEALLYWFAVFSLTVDFLDHIENSLYCGLATHLCASFTIFIGSLTLKTGRCGLLTLRSFSAPL